MDKKRMGVVALISALVFLFLMLCGLLFIRFDSDGGFSV